MSVYGIGPFELLIIVALAALVFGAPVIFFLLGYGLGRRSTSAPPPPEPESTPEESPDE